MSLGGHDSYRLRADATVRAREDGALSLHVSRYRLVLSDLGAARRSVLLRLAEDWTSDARIGEMVTALEGESRILQVQVLVRGLLTQSWLGRRLHAADGRPLVETVPRGLGPKSLPDPVAHDAGTVYRLSRFAQLRADAGLLLAETPRTTVAVALLDGGLAAAAALAAGPGVTVDGLADLLGTDTALAGRVLDELLTARVLVSPAGAAEETDLTPLAAWSPRELAMHDRSRPGRHVLPVGGTYPLRGRVEPEPLARRFEAARSITLPEVDLALAAKTDPTLTAVVEARRTVRRHDDDHPITLAQLGEFLHRVARTTPLGVDASGLEIGRRPYPSGGALHELELYAFVTRCDGLDPGVYHYEAVGHRLEHLGGLDAPARRALDYVSAAATLTEPPQVYLVVSARIGRLTWKYEGFGYALALKHAGLLTELMYLVATAMGLAPCAVGAGDAAAFATATGLDPFAEPSIADFILGSRPAAERSDLDTDHGREGKAQA